MRYPSQSYKAVIFHIGHLRLLCHPHGGSAVLGKCVCSFYFVSSLDAWINAWGFVSDLHFCSGFRWSKKVEKHWNKPLA